MHSCPLRAATLLLLGSVTLAGCATRRAATPEATGTSVATCDLDAATPWIERWLGAWDLTSREILRLTDARVPDVVFYDDDCVYTTSRVSAGAAAAGTGTTILAVGPAWWAVAHGGSITLPNGQVVPVQLMSFTNSDRESGPFIVMAAPEYWAKAGHGQEPGLTAVFMHELSHTQQLPGMARVIGPIDDAWSFPEELSDDIVQTRFSSDSAYVASYLAERDLLYRAAEAASIEAVRTLAAEALEMMRTRHARWFSGENAVFATLDATWLSMEGAGQWAAQAWLAHPAGGGLDPDAAVRRMLGQRRWWVQDHGLALFLVVDRLLPAWPSLVFAVPAIGAVDLLARAVER